MASYIATVQAIVGVVKAVGGIKGERLLQPGDLIYDDDILISEGPFDSQVITTNGINITLNLGERWQYEEGGAFDITSNKQITFVDSSNRILSSIDYPLDDNNFVASEEKIVPVAEGGLTHAYRVNGQMTSGRLVRISEEILHELFNSNGPSFINKFSGLLPESDYLNFKKTPNTFLNDERVTPDSPAITPIVETPPVIIDTLPEVIIDSVPEVIVDTVPEVIVDTLPEVIVDTVPEVIVDTVPEVIVDTLPEVIIDTLQKIPIDTLAEVIIDALPEVIIDIISDKITLELNSDNGLSSNDNITSDTRINLIGLEATSIWEYSTDSGISWVLGIGSFFNLATTTVYIDQQIQVKTKDLAGNIHIEKMAAVTIDSSISEVVDADSTADLVSEHIPSGTAIGITALATDDDGDTITYALTANPGSLFAINSSTGVVTLAGSLDFETATSHDIEITATSNDGSSKRKSFTINVANANDIAEITLLDIDNNFAVITVPHEMAHIVGNVVDNEGIDYPSSTISALHGTAILDNVTGNIIYTSNHNNLTDTITISVVDNAGETTTQTIPVSVNLAPDFTAKSVSDVLVSIIKTPEIIGETSEVDISTPGTILKTASGGWGTTIISANSVQASKGVLVEFQSQGAGNVSMWGLNIAGEAPTIKSFEVIDYAIYLVNGGIFIYENGSGVGTSQTYDTSDVFSVEINKTTGVVTYLKNSVVFYTSNNIADLNGEYVFTGAPLSIGTGISGLKFGSTDALAIYENTGANETIAILAVDDPDSASWTYALVSGDGDKDNTAVIIGGVNNNEIILKANPATATQENYSVRIKVTDGYGNTREETVSFRVITNQAPIDLIVKDSSGTLVSPIITPEIIGDISEVDTSVSGTILKTRSGGWGTTITSANNVQASKGVLVEFQAQGSGNAGMWGLNIAGQAPTIKSFEVIDYAIYLINGGIYIYENGLGVGTSQTYNTSDVLSVEINKTTGVVTYLKNGAVFHTSSNIADLQAEYNFTGAPLSIGMGISDLQLGNTDSLTIYENAGTNETIAILAVEDADSTSWTYVLVSGNGDNDNAAVIIGGVNNNEIILLADPSIAVKENYSVRVRVTDNHNKSYEEIIEFKVVENAAPIHLVVEHPSGENLVGLAVPAISGDTSEANLSTPGTIIKTAATGWATTITSENNALGKQGIKLEFQAEGSGNGGMWGINVIGQVSTTRSYDVIDYAIYLSGSSASIYENGISKGGYTSYTSVDVFSVEMDKNTGKVSYLKNGVIFHTSAITADVNAEYHFTGAPYNSGIGISNLKFTDQDTLSVYENEGANKTIAVLGVNDPDSSSWSYTLVSGGGDSDNAAVTIGGADNNEIILAANPNVANQENYTIRVQVTDNHNNSYQEIIEFKVIKNAAPTNVLVSNSLFEPVIVGEMSEVNITIPSTIIKTAATGWATTVASQNSVLASIGVQVEFSAQGAGNAGMWGLNIAGQAATTRSYDVIDYAIYLLSGTAYIFENSLNIGAFNTYSTTDTFAINIDKDSGVVTYLQNGSVFNTSSNLADLDKEYLFTGAPYSSGIGIGHLKFGSLESTIYEDEGVNKTAVFLRVEDEDSSSWTYSLISGNGDSDNDAVTIGGLNNNEIILTANPNIANQENYTVRVQVTDSYNNSYQEIVTFKVIENTAPLDILVNKSLEGSQNSLAIPTVTGEIGEVDILTPGTIIKTTFSGWATTIASQNSVLASKGVQVEFSAQGAGNAGMWGLNIAGQAITARSYDIIDYAIYLVNGSIFVFENSLNIGKFNSYSTADSFAVNIDKNNGEVTYLQNGSIFYTSNNRADLSAEYLFTGTPYSSGIGISNLKFGSLEPTVYENEGANTTVAVLGVVDDDSSSWIYTLVSGDGDSDNSAVTIGGINNNEIILGANPNTADQERYTVRVRVTDNHNKSYEEVIGFNVIKNIGPKDLKVQDAFIGDVSEVDLSIAGSVLGVDGTGWGALVNSKDKALASDGVSVSFKAITDSNTLMNGMFGLNASHLTTATAGVSHSYEVIDYALSLADGNVHVYENGALLSGHGAYSVNDLFTIAIDAVSGVVTYLKNGISFYTSLNPATLTDEFWFAAAPYAQGTGITDLELSFKHFTVYENIGSNKSIATLITTDRDSSSWVYSLALGAGDQDNSAVQIGGINSDELIFIGHPSIAVQTDYSVRVQVIDNHGKAFEKVLTFAVQPDPKVVDLLLKNENGSSLEETFTAPTFKREIGDVDLSTDGVVIKTAVTGWSTIIETEQAVRGSLGPSVEFKAFSAGDAGMWGLNLPGETNATAYNIIDYAIDLSASGAAVYENGSSIAVLGAYTIADTFAISVNKESGEVTYLKNGAVVYTSLTKADLNAEYVFVGAPNAVGEGITDLKFKQFNDVTVYENIGENDTIAFLDTDDDSTTWVYSIVAGLGDDDNAVVRIGGASNDELILAVNPNVPLQDSYSVRLRMTNVDDKFYEEVFEFKVVERILSTPLILDLDGDGVETLSQISGVLFDIDADGTQDKTGWAAGDDGFLVRDVNQDGLINDASELFGEYTLKQNGEKAKDGFDALSFLDNNFDGIIDNQDEVYNDLLIWQDANGDGISQAHELFSLVDKGVGFIDLNRSEIAENNQGNFSGLRSAWIDALGKSNDVDDVWLAYEKGQTETLDSSDLMSTDPEDEINFDNVFNLKQVEDDFKEHADEAEFFTGETVIESDTPSVLTFYETYSDITSNQDVIKNLIENKLIISDI